MFETNIDFYHKYGCTSDEEVLIVSTGVRPICFCENVDSYIWGIGSCFLINHNGHVYAVTAKHVIENQEVEPRHTKILMLNTSVTLPIKSAFTPKLSNHEYENQVEDLVFFEIDNELFRHQSDLDLFSWSFMENSYPASKLEIGDELLIAGFPGVPDKYDYDKNKINDLLLLRTANLDESSLGKGLYTMSGTPSEFTFNGLSGSPIFCKKDENVLFVGISIRGSQSSGFIHFIGSEIILSALNIHLKE